MEKKLAKQIRDAVRQDEKMRQAFRKKGPWDNMVDLQNTIFIKKVITKHGWPTVQSVGVEASRGAWLLVQHADHDTSFQEHCLTLMKREFKKNKASVDTKLIAYLTDRVLVHKGEKQLYGTQLRIKKTGSVPLPIKDIKNLDKRRKTMNMLPFKEYQKSIKNSAKVR